VSGLGLGLSLDLGGGGSLWDPISLTWSMYCRADTIAGADGSQVASWTSRAADAQSVVQATGANKPTLVKSNPNFRGQPTVRFAGSQFMALASMNFGTAGSNTFVWAVCRLTTGGAISLVVNLANTGYGFQLRYAAANQPEMLGSSAQQSTWGVAELNATVALAAYCDGAAGAGHAQSLTVGNATPVANGSTTTVQSPATMALTVGAFTGGSFSLIGDIAEWGVMPQEPGANARVFLESYARARYGAQ